MFLFSSIIIKQNTARHPKLFASRFRTWASIFSAMKSRRSVRYTKLWRISTKGLSSSFQAGRIFCRSKTVWFRGTCQRMQLSSLWRMSRGSGWRSRRGAYVEERCKGCCKTCTSALGAADSTVSHHSHGWRPEHKTLNLLGIGSTDMCMWSVSANGKQKSPTCSRALETRGNMISRSLI